MKVLYRPQRATLDEAMAELKEFGSLKECLEWIVKDADGLLTLDRLFISYYGYDKRIDWETYIVCDGSEEICKEYDSPQGWGFLTFKEDVVKKDGVLNMDKHISSLPPDVAENFKTIPFMKILMGEFEVKEEKNDKD